AIGYIKFGAQIVNCGNSPRTRSLPGRGAPAVRNLLGNEPSPVPVLFSLRLGLTRIALPPAYARPCCREPRNNARGTAAFASLGAGRQSPGPPGGRFAKQPVREKVLTRSGSFPVS